MTACRRRRIKCGEERPTCKNCTKSKRECEGYIPRVVFKDPVSAFRQDMDALHEHHLYGHHGYDSNGVPIGAATSLSGPDGIPLAPLAPRPSSYDSYHGALHAKQAGAYAYASQLGRTGYGASEPFNKVHLGYTGTNQPRVPSTSAYTPYEHSSDQVAVGNTTAQYQSPTTVTTSGNGFAMKPTLQTSLADWSQMQTSTAPPMQYPTPQSTTSNEGTFPPPEWPLQSQGQMVSLDGSSRFDNTGLMGSTTVADDFTTPQAFEHNQTYGLPVTYPTQYKVEPEDDWFDVDSDEENPNMSQQLGEPNPSDLGLMIKMAAHQNNPNVRSITNFLNGPNMLATYVPSYSASPLMDPQTARVFCHFIAATGPTLNVFERHPSNPSVIFTGRPAPQSQRSLWSYTMPMLALNHQGLLQSMLALSSLHIAKIQRTSPTPSLKHYHYALRRVAKALGKPDKRGDVATLAATLLLGFYEVTTAEHNKWNSHLSGARELITEIDFLNMARRADLQQQRQKAQDVKNLQRDLTGLTDLFTKPSPPDKATKTSPRLDDNFMRTISGWTIRYDDHGPLVDGTQTSLDFGGPLQPRDIEWFEVQCDLFWWYAKQDMYQSILSGNRLL